MLGPSLFIIYQRYYRADFASHQGIRYGCVHYTNICSYQGILDSMAGHEKTVHRCTKWKLSANVNECVHLCFHGEHNRLLPAVLSFQRTSFPRSWKLISWGSYFVVPAHGRHSPTKLPVKQAWVWAVYKDILSKLPEILGKLHASHVSGQSLGYACV